MAYLKTHDGTKIYYKHLNKKSSKTPMVFIHGYVANWTCFKQEIDFFKKEKHPIIYLDLRGHGLSKNPPKEHITIEDTTQDIKDLLMKTNIKKAIIIGHSLGGIIALNFSTKNPELIEKLIIIDSSYKMPQRLKILNKILEKRLIKYLIKKLFIKNKKPKKITTQKEPWDVTDEEKQTNPKWFFIKSILRSNAQTVYYFAEEILTKKIKNLHKITAPTLIIGHKSDEFFTKQETIKAAKKIKNHKIKLMEGNHDSIMRKPEQIIKEIKKFLN